MPQLAVLIIHDPTKLTDVLNAWVDAGITGVTILDSSGLGHLLPGETRDDLPLFPSLADLLQSAEERHRTIFSVIADDFDLNRLVAATETILGQLAEPNTGILFVTPVTRVWGLQPGRTKRK
ncbi:MAG: hypothetical protein HYZ49_18075 [Chloroflexi bacterium]|nr:hypothetical protein [Chloroflexota bacterium]